MNSPFDPSDEPLEIGATAATDQKSSIRSFWLACSGLVILALVTVNLLGSLGVLTLRLTWKFAPTDAAAWQQWSGSQAHRNLAYIQNACVISLSQLSSAVVWISILPVAFWRGSLSRRFLISAGISASVLFLISEWTWGFSFDDIRNQAWESLAVIFCWTALPVVMVLPIFQSRRWLRLLISGGIITLSVCVSFASLENFWRVANQITDAGIGIVVSMAFALSISSLRVQALFEADVSITKIARTTSLMIMELTAIVAVLSVALLPYFMQVSEYRFGVWLLITTFILAFATAGLTFSCLPGSMRPRAKMIGLLLCAGLNLAGLAILLENYTYFWVPGQSLPLRWLVYIAAGLIHFSGLYLYARLCIAWIGWCGWRWQRAAT